MNPQLRLALCAIPLACATLASQAQVIDDVDVRREGNNAVLEFRFANEVQFQRSVATRSGDLVQVFYSLVGLADSDLPRASQGLRLGTKQGLPDIRVSDEIDRNSRKRRLELRFAKTAKVTVRAGRGNRTIEVVIEGAGAGLQAAQPAQTTSPAPSQLAEGERKFVIALQSSTDARLELTQRIPRSLQSYDVFTGHRVVNGATRYEFNLGYFANRTEAEQVLKQLGDFPQAEIVALAPAVLASAPTTTTQAQSSPNAGAAPTITTPAEVEAKASGLLNTARSAYNQQSYPAALESLNELLNLPQNSSTREAQELAGMARLRGGDIERARIEFETYLQLFPQGEGSDRVRRQVAGLPAPAPRLAESATPRGEAETTVTGSTSMYYYGGNGKVRSQDFQDSPINGLPQVAGDPLFSADKQRQIFNDVDLNWRRRDAEQDVRMVFRDSYITDQERPSKSKNRLSSAYVDYKSLTNGYGVRLGRQSPTGGGVMGRFDGAQANVSLRPKLKLGAVAGVPTDKLFDSRRQFYGVSIDADSLLVPNLGTGLYTIHQTIDGEVDRQAMGLELRYFKGGASVFSQLDYDTKIKGLNIATIQGTVIDEDNTVYNALYDRRALTMLALGNALTFEDPTNPGLVTRIADKLNTTTLELLRQQIKDITPYITQAQVGVTKPVTPHFQVGGSAQLTNIGAIPPVPGVLGFETGRPATGNLYTVSGQLIGLNLYSPRDTHVFSSSVISGPTYRGYLVSYNNSSIAWDVWQFEPSLQYYRDRTPQGSTSDRWTPGMRVTYRGWQRWAIESSLTYEIGKASRVTPDPIDPTLSTTTKESSNRVNYSLGARYEF